MGGRQHPRQQLPHHVGLGLRRLRKVRYCPRSLRQEQDYEVRDYRCTPSGDSDPYHRVDHRRSCEGEPWSPLAYYAFAERPVRVSGMPPDQCCEEGEANSVDLPRPVPDVLDGLDECEDRVEIATFIEDQVPFFSKNPRTPLLFMITSRVESHLCHRLHGSSQSYLLDLLEHTPNSDISAALDAAISKEKNSRIFACDRSWPSAEEKAKLFKHIGGSFIFMNVIKRFPCNSEGTHGRRPMEYLPVVLGLRPYFDELYRAVSGPRKDRPHCTDVVGTLALAQELLSIAQLSDILRIDPPNVIQVLLNLQSIVRAPGDDRTPITLWHPEKERMDSGISASTGIPRR
ncbi:hypothetical protein NMY22_g9155 [Coprinellus aureogranulatus]|nr:hypothetical protein NMY22_g9155 [Coprinellus aureogranulatus]